MIDVKNGGPFQTLANVTGNGTATEELQGIGKKTAGCLPGTPGTGLIECTRGVNAGKILSVEDFDLYCRNLLHTLAPLMGVDIIENDVQGFMQEQIESGKYRVMN